MVMPSILPRLSQGQLLLLSMAVWILLIAAAVAMPSDHQFVASSTATATDGMQQQQLPLDFTVGKVNDMIPNSASIQCCDYYSMP